MTEQPLDLRRVIAAIWRNRIAFFACIGVALVGAAAFSFAGPPPYTAKALVLLPASPLDSSGAPTRDVATQVRIASSSDVLALAVRALHPTPKLADLTKNVRVTAPTPDILQFSARASSRGRSTATANQVANSYVVYSERGASELLTRVVAALKTQADALSARASALQTRINAATTILGRLDPNSSAASSESALLDSLRAQQGDVANQLLNVNSQISDAQLNSAVTNSGTRILERATTASNSAFLVGARNLAGGLLLGALVGTMLALGLDGRDRRLRRRDDIASAAGVPTIASLTTRVAQNPEEWFELISNYEPSVDERWGLRWTLRHLITAHEAVPARATIVCLAGDDDAVAVPLQLATFSANAGVRTVLVADAGAQNVSALRDAPRTTDGVRDPVIPNLWFFDSQTKSVAGAEHLAPQLVIKVLITDDGRLAGARAGADRDSTTTLLAVSSGFATTEALTSVSLTATEAGRPLFGVIVANPRPDDDTSGRMPRPAGGARPILPTRVTRSARGAT